MNQLEANEILNRQKAKTMNSYDVSMARYLEEGSEIMLAGASRIVEAVEYNGLTTTLHTTDGVFIVRSKQWVKVYS